MDVESEQVRQKNFSTYIVFRVKDNLFSISGQDVAAIQLMPDTLLDIPNAPDYVRGSYSTWGSIFTVVDLHRVFDWKTSRAEYEEFVQMIEARKQDHVNWVNVLKSCRESGRPFTLAKDCHQCNLGRWRDNYHAKVQSVNHLLQQLDGPHEELHHLADTVLRNDSEGERALSQLENDLVPKVLSLLDAMKAEFKESEFREMLIILQGEAKIALTVDDVLGVESLNSINTEGTFLSRQNSSYVRGIQQRVGDQELVMELDVPLLTAELSWRTEAQA